MFDKPRYVIWTVITNRGETMPPHYKYAIINMTTKKIETYAHTLQWAQYYIERAYQGNAPKALGQ